MPSAKQIRKQIKDLQAQLVDLGDDIRIEKLNALEQWMVEHFGRKLKVGDELTRIELRYDWNKETKKSTVSKRIEIKVKVIEPMEHYLIGDAPHTDISYIYWGTAYIAVENPNFEKWKDGAWYHDSLSKTKLKKYKLTSAL